MAQNTLLPSEDFSKDTALIISDKNLCRDVATWDLKAWSGPIC